MFDRGDFYATYGADALYAAIQIYQTNSVIKYLGGAANHLPSVTFNTMQATNFLRDSLTSKQLKVEIWASEDGKGKKGAKFSLKTEVIIHSGQ